MRCNVLAYYYDIVGSEPVLLAFSAFQNYIGSRLFSAFRRYRRIIGIEEVYSSRLSHLYHEDINRSPKSLYLKLSSLRFI